MAQARDWLAEGTGTVVIWRKLDRVLPEKRPDGGWARRRLQAMAAKTAEHLGMVFHRFLEDDGDRDLVTHRQRREGAAVESLSPPGSRRAQSWRCSVSRWSSETSPERSRCSGSCCRPATSSAPLRNLRGCPGR